MRAGPLRGFYLSSFDTKFKIRFFLAAKQWDQKFEKKKLKLSNSCHYSFNIKSNILEITSNVTKYLGNFYM